MSLIPEQPIYFNTKSERDEHELQQSKIANTFYYTDDYETFVIKMISQGFKSIWRSSISLQMKNTINKPPKTIGKRVSFLLYTAVQKGFLKNIGKGKYEIV